MFVPFLTNPPPDAAGVRQRAGPRPRALPAADAEAGRRGQRHARGRRALRRCQRAGGEDPQPRGGRGERGAAAGRAQPEVGAAEGRPGAVPPGIGWRAGGARLPEGCAGEVHGFFRDVQVGGTSGADGIN